MPLYTLTWTETRQATIEADSESAARQAWIDGLDGEPVDNRHEYDLTVELLGVVGTKIVKPDWYDDLRTDDIIVLHFRPESPIYRHHVTRQVRVTGYTLTELVALPCDDDGESLDEGLGFYPFADIERIERR